MKRPLVIIYPPIDLRCIAEIMRVVAAAYPDATVSDGNPDTSMTMRGATILEADTEITRGG